MSEIEYILPKDVSKSGAYICKEEVPDDVNPIRYHIAYVRSRNGRKFVEFDNEGIESPLRSIPSESLWWRIPDQ